MLEAAEKWQRAAAVAVDFPELRDEELRGRERTAAFAGFGKTCDQAGLVVGGGWGQVELPHFDDEPDYDYEPT